LFIIQNSEKLEENTMFQKLDLLPSLGKGRETPENVNRPSFQNVVFYNYLEFQMMDKVHKPSVCERYAPS
jgi:hypothetical protein